MSSIRITKTPTGLAPEEIREQWVGVTIPLASDEEIAEDPPSGWGIGSDNLDGHLVLRSAAIQSLRGAGKNEAADFWEALPLGRFLVFTKLVCELTD